MTKKLIVLVQTMILARITSSDREQPPSRTRADEVMASRAILLAMLVSESDLEMQCKHAGCLGLSAIANDIIIWAEDTSPNGRWRDKKPNLLKSMNDEEFALAMYGHKDGLYRTE